MDIDGYVRVAAAIPEVRVADTTFNAKALCSAIDKCDEQGAEIIVTPELGVTGYSCGDLFLQQTLIDGAEDAIKLILTESIRWNGIIAVGVPVSLNGSLYNCAAIINKGSLLGLIPKSHLPNYGEYYEKRWFTPGINLENQHINYADTKTLIGPKQLFCKGILTLGVEICEDLWVPSPPSTKAALQGANVIINLSATNEVAGKHAYLVNLISQQSARLHSAYVYSSAGFGESSSDLVFGGNGIIAEDGRILRQTDRFGLKEKYVVADIDLQMLERDRIYSGAFERPNNEAWNKICVAEPDNHHFTSSALLRPIAKHPFVPTSDDGKCEEIANIQIEGLRRRLFQLHGCPSVIGLSGGLDSTLALLVTVMAYQRQGWDINRIHAITMPGFGTTHRTRSNAVKMTETLGVTLVEIPIGAAAAVHLHDIGHDGKTTDITYENAQARERTQVLMDYANKINGIVIGTGDLSELALGWCTYNGDHMSMYGVNAGVPKTLVRYLVEWYGRELKNQELADILNDILDTPVSPELIPSADGQDDIAQRTEDLVGPYELHDFFLYHLLRHGFHPRKINRMALQAFKGSYDADTITHWLRIFIHRFFTQQFKRNCMPDGPKVGSVCLSPRGDWRMPSDAQAALWLNELKKPE